jgi:hypothetical protein
VETFLLVLAAIFPVVNPPGAALVFLSMTKYTSANTRRQLARRVAGERVRSHGGISLGGGVHPEDLRDISSRAQGCRRPHRRPRWLDVVERGRPEKSR